MKEEEKKRFHLKEKFALLLNRHWNKLNMFACVRCDIKWDFYSIWMFVVFLLPSRWFSVHGVLYFHLAAVNLHHFLLQSILLWSIFSQLACCSLFILSSPSLSLSASCRFVCQHFQFVIFLTIIQRYLSLAKKGRFMHTE